MRPDTPPSEGISPALAVAVVALLILVAEICGPIISAL